MKKKRKSIKTVPSWFLLIGEGVAVAAGFGFLIFLYTYPPSVEALLAADLKHFIIDVFGTVVLGILSVSGLVIMIRQGIFSLVTIDEKGMRRALFGVFCKLNISWDELKEMKCFSRVIFQLFCSKDIELKPLQFDEAAKKRHSLIQLPLSPKVLAVVRLYTDIEIIGIPEDVLQRFIEKYK